MYLEGMGPRQSIASEVLDTIKFGALDLIKGAGSYSKKLIDKGDAYVIPFGTSKNFYGAVIVRNPKSIEVRYIVNQKKQSYFSKSCDDTKRFLVRNFIQ